MCLYSSCPFVGTVPPICQKSNDEYGLIIHDGGTSLRAILYCPWCGATLPASKRERWFDELAALGFDNPIVQPIPIAFTTDAWYRRNSVRVNHQ
jgi:hypothetical protein